MPELCRLLVVCVLFVSPVRSHESAYDFIFNNVTRITSSQTYLNHPFENGIGSNKANVSHRQLSAKWEPLRIHVDTSILATQQHKFGDEAKKVLHRITSFALPKAIQILTKHLHVIRVKGDLALYPQCMLHAPNKKGFDHLVPTESTHCRVTPRDWKYEWEICHGIIVPRVHHYMSAANTDFVLYLTAEDKNVTDKTLVRALAWGDACRIDQHHRPVAARIHLFLKFLAFKNSQGHLSNNYLVTVLTHELSHALGWTYGNFRWFRDEYGNIRKNAITYKKALGKTITLLSTPTVTKYVREHFGCNSLTGLELEDQHPGHSARSHPEKRIFPESFMSSSILTMSNYHIDALALSVFQDSGWYQVR